MAWLDVFDTFIGLVTIYLVLSLIVTAVGEGISTWTGLRGRILRKLIFQLLGKTAGVQFLERDAIQRLYAPKGNPIFDILQKITKIRSSIQPEKSGSIPADDAGPPGKPATVAAPAARTVIRSRRSVSDSLTNLMGFGMDRLGFSELNQFWCAR